MSVLTVTGREEIVQLLDEIKNFKQKNDPGTRARSLLQLKKALCSYYCYSELLVSKLLLVFSPGSLFEYIDANESSRPVTIRTNTLLARRKHLIEALREKGAVVEKCGEWTKVGIQIFESPFPIGATSEYLAGHYLVQSAASFLPVIALDPKENERVLDMCAAPGGKTTHIAALMKNKGILFANDQNKDRTKSLVANIQRMGVKNTIVICEDGLCFPDPSGHVDRVLLDAPCSGSGVISKSSEAKYSNTEKDMARLVRNQKKLLSTAIKTINKRSSAGIVVYSTCSVICEENEEVVDYVLSKYPGVSLVETGIPFGCEGLPRCREKLFHPSLRLARRFYPHLHNTDGFFVAKLKVSHLNLKKSPSNKRNVSELPRKQKK